MSAITQLASTLGQSWSHIEAARLKSIEKFEQMTTAVERFTDSDTSIVVFGSLARFELTSGSDIDWTLLLDGSCSPYHITVTKDIAAAVGKLTHKDVGQEGTFGTLASSHDIINYIGGELDTNSNTTRRNLLLLESRAIGSSQAYDRVKRNLLHRYLSEDSGLWRPAVKNKLPHFLLNDLSRYWRTMTVDYAYKERMRGGKGIPLRNLKLGMSRKLIFVAGLLACYECHLDFNDDASRESFYAEKNVPALVLRMDHTLKMTPLELVAHVLRRYHIHFEAAANLFTAYDKFLGLLLDAETRSHLEALHSDDAENDVLFQEAKSVRRSFRDALSEIFLNQSSLLGDFTIRYGVF